MNLKTVMKPDAKRLAAAENNLTAQSRTIATPG